MTALSRPIGSTTFSASGYTNSSGAKTDDVGEVGEVGPEALALQPYLYIFGAWYLTELVDCSG
jgi:hypothetical protein